MDQSREATRLIIEKSSYDLALIFAQDQMQRRLAKSPDMDESEIIFHLQDDFCYSMAKMSDVDEETIISMLIDQDRP